MTTLHPHKNDHGQPVILMSPSTPSSLGAWADASQHAIVTPRSPMPAVLNGLSFTSWQDPPCDGAGWEQLAASSDFVEPPFKAIAGKKVSSGVVVVELDGRIWVVSPSNRFGGYTNTFPKGTLSPGEKLSLRANAIKETFEETGLKVELTGFLADCDRSTGPARYYLGRRLGGNPADMGWETQAVHLVPRELLPGVTSHKNDGAILAALA